MKRMTGYLLGCPCLITTFMRQHQPDRIRIFTDSDHARCRNTTKSTSSINTLHGMNFIETVPSTAFTIVLSSPESEYDTFTKWYCIWARDPFGYSKRYMRKLWRFSSCLGRTTNQTWVRNEFQKRVWPQQWNLLEWVTKWEWHHRKYPEYNG